MLREFTQPGCAQAQAQGESHLILSLLQTSPFRSVIHLFPLGRHLDGAPRRTWVFPAFVLYLSKPTAAALKLGAIGS